jgi:diguanylate cyclase (GGDEF)-like protein
MEARMADAEEPRPGVKPSELAKRPSAPDSGGFSIRLPRTQAVVDSILLEYLSKPTAPSMEAVRLPIANYAAHPTTVSAAATTAPAEGPIQTVSGTFVSPAHGESPVPMDSPEDERPTGQWATPAAGNPLDLVRDRGVLVRLDGDASGEVISIPRRGVRVGRSGRAQVHIPEPSVSREHARIVYEYGAYYVVDESSQNGTQVAGRRIVRAELRDGDLVVFGQRATYRFSLMDQTQEQVMRRLFESSTRDPLTGADNRRNMDSRLQAEIAFAERHSRPLSVILLDIDFFKAVNDRHGHPAGDEVLKAVAAVVRGQLRTEDAFARYGGEEFVIVLRDTALLQAALVAERVRERIAKTPIEMGSGTINVTVSAGCASLACCVGASIENLIGAADRRLYKAKRTGRNRVVSSEDSVAAAR